MKKIITLIAFFALLLIGFGVKANAQGEFVYVNNGTGGNTISAFSMSETGTLTQIAGSPFATGASGFRGSPILVVGNFLYAGNSNSLNVSGFSINPASGSLTPVPRSPFPVEGVSYGTIMTLAATPDGRFLMVSNITPGTITTFRIAGDGSLTPIATPPFLVGEAVYDMKVSPDGRFLAAALNHRNWVAVLNIAPDGSLTPVPGSPFSTNRSFAFANSLAFNCEGSVLFVGNARNGPPQIDVFRVANNGSLSLVQGSPFTSTEGTDSGNVLLSPNNQFLYVTNFESNTLTVFKGAADNTLTAVPDSPFKVKDSRPAALAMNNKGTVLFSGNFGGGNGLTRISISAYAVSKDGELHHVAGSPFLMDQFSYLNNSVSLSTYPVGDCALRITGVTVSGKKLFVQGKNFDNGSVILLNGEWQKTANDEENHTTVLIAKKSGKKVKAGDRLQVQTSNGRLSNEFTFPGTFTH